MEDKKPAKAERVPPLPPQPPAKRNLRSTSAAQATASRVAPTEQNKTSDLRKSLMAAPRALLDNEGILKAEERITAESLYNALKVIREKYNSKMSSEVQKIMVAFHASLGVLAAEKNAEQDPSIMECAKVISARVEEAIDKGLTKLSTAMEYSLANQKDIKATTKRIEESTAVIQESATAIHKAIEEVDKNLAEVTDTSNKLTSTMSSYKDALLTTPKPAQQTTANKAMSASDPRIIRDQNRKACQVLVDIYNKEVVNRSLEELKNNFNALIGIEPTEPLSDANVQHIIKLRNGGLILQFETKEAAEWFKQPAILTSILPSIDSTATLKDRAYQILVPRVPITFNPDEEESLRELEEQNGMKDGILRKARWIKPTYRRALGQRYAHLALSVSTPGEANVIIRDGIYICGIKAYPRKLKTEPKQCMKCRKWGHFAAECLEDKDACGNCGEDHHTKECPDKERRYCVSCKIDTHASWDRSCPEFLRRVEKMDESHPENALMYFPTDEDWSTQVCPAKYELDIKFPAKYEVASLPLPTKDGRQPPTRQVANKKKGPRLVQYKERGPMDEYLKTANTDKTHKPESHQMEDELLNSLSDEEITRQLDNTFSEE